MTLPGAIPRLPIFFWRLALAYGWFFAMCGRALLGCAWRWGDLDLVGENCRSFARVAARILRIEIRFEGLEHLPAGGPAVVVCNHQSFLDIVTFGINYPKRCIVIAKKELRWMPLLGLVLMASGNIFLHRQRRDKAWAGIALAAEEMRRKRANVLIFPEGTRNHSHRGLLPFKKGAFALAIAGQAPVVAMVSSPLDNVIGMEGSPLRWHLGEGVVRIRILPPIQTQGLGPADVSVLSDRVRATMLETMAALESSRA